MTRILHAERVDHGKEKALDLELLLNLIGSIFPINKFQRSSHYRQRLQPTFAKSSLNIVALLAMIGTVPRRVKT